MSKNDAGAEPTIFVVGFCLGILVMWFVERGLTMRS